MTSDEPRITKHFGEISGCTFWQLHWPEHAHEEKGCKAQIYLSRWEALAELDAWHKAQS